MKKLFIITIFLFTIPLYAVTHIPNVKRGKYQRPNSLKNRHKSKSFYKDQRNDHKKNLNSQPKTHPKK